MTPVRPRVPRALTVRGAALRVLVLAVAIGLSAGPGSAQTGLEEIDQLTRAGSTAAARAALVVWWDAEHDAASRDVQQRALWLRARLTVDPEQAMRDYQRLVVLYPGGTFTDQALLRLAQAAHAMGDGRQAQAHVEALVRDYPGSPVRSTAERWLEAAGDPPPPPAGTPSQAAPERAGAAPRTPSGDVPSGGAPGAATPARYYAVQLGAFGEEDRALGVAAAGREAGFDVRMVRVEGSPFFHVRVGMFPDRPEALELFNSLARAGVQGALVQDERAELPAPR